MGHSEFSDLDIAGDAADGACHMAVLPPVRDYRTFFAEGDIAGGGMSDRACRSDVAGLGSFARNAVSVDSVPRRNREVRPAGVVQRVAGRSTPLVPFSGRSRAPDDLLPDGQQSPASMLSAVPAEASNSAALTIGGPTIHLAAYATGVRGTLPVGLNDLAVSQERLEECPVEFEYDRSRNPGPADLCIVVDGRRLLPVEMQRRRFSFVVPRHRSVHLASRYGMNVSKIEVIMNEEYLVFPADHPMLLSGWTPAADGGNGFWRPLSGLDSFPGVAEATATQIIVWIEENTTGKDSRLVNH